MSTVAPLVHLWAHDYLGGPAVQIEPLSSFESQFSRVQRLRVRAGGREEVVYAKTFVIVDASAEERARQLRYLTAESERLRDAAHAFRDTPWLRVPRLLASLPEHLTIITSHVEGEPLASILTRAALCRTGAACRRATDALARSGEWVRRFQELVPIRDESAYSKDYRLYLDDRLRILTAGASGLFTERHRAAVLARFDEHAAHLAPDDWWPRAAHGDFCPANILVTGTAVSVIDFAMSTDRVRYLDLTHLYFHLALLARRLPLGRRMLRAFHQALLDGFAPCVTADSPLFRTLLLQHAVCYLVQFVSTARRTPFDAWRFRRRLGWALRLAGVHVPPQGAPIAPGARPEP